MKIKDGMKIKVLGNAYKLVDRDKFIDFIAYLIFAPLWSAYWLLCILIYCK